MSKTSVQSRKMCFVEVEEEARDFFQQAFQEHEVSFVERLDAVPEDIEVLSVFMSRRLRESEEAVRTGHFEARERLSTLSSKISGATLKDTR
jgi:hypothetical protein